MTVVQVLGIVHRKNVSVVAPRKEEAGSNQVEKVHVIDYTLFSCTSRIVDNTSKLYFVHTCGHASVVRRRNLGIRADVARNRMHISLTYFHIASSL